jgi:uncharacterized repeat protein (TIGR03803 family)
VQEIMRIATFILCGLIVASCSRVTGSSPLPADLMNGPSVRHLPSSGYKSLYSFNGEPDGAWPVAGLVAVNGTLYGTTWYGGNSTCSSGSVPGCGTVFKIATSGTESVLYSFKGGTDGASPRAGLVAVSGTLYGTTPQGGGAGCGGEGCGTIFNITASGQERLLHRFKGKPDGAYPQASLIALNGTLYGTTIEGGACKGSGCGTIFTVSTSGKERVLYRFKGGKDGDYPEAALSVVSGKLYGTTYGGGASGYGTVFEITTSGQEKVLYSFKGGSDGAWPGAGLVAVNGSLYGSTQYGGSRSSSCAGSGIHGCGIVFKITTSGAESVLHCGNYGNGCGTVFALSMSGKERVLYGFKGDFESGPDGSNPDASLVALKGTLYGTALDGGNSSCGPSGNGCGTVFSISP